VLALLPSLKHLRYHRSQRRRIVHQPTSIQQPLVVI